MQISIKYVIDVDHNDIVYGLSEASQRGLVTSTPNWQTSQPRSLS